MLQSARRAAALASSVSPSRGTAWRAMESCTSGAASLRRAGAVPARGFAAAPPPPMDFADPFDIESELTEEERMIMVSRRTN
jgi:hypothetical protein